MRARLATPAGIGLMLSLALAAPGAANVNIPCGPASAHTLASDGVARVYSQNKHVYGCAASDQKSFRLGQASGNLDRRRVGPLALSGVDAAYGLTTSGVDTISADVVVRRLTDGKVLHRQNAISGKLSAEFYEAVDAVVVKRDGSVAWTANGGSILSGKPPRRQVNRIDKSGYDLLDSHRNIRLHSLKLSGSKLTWRDGSATQSATLR